MRPTRLLAALLLAAPLAAPAAARAQGTVDYGVLVAGGMCGIATDPATGAQSVGVGQLMAGGSYKLTLDARLDTLGSSLHGYGTLSSGKLGGAAMSEFVPWVLTPYYSCSASLNVIMWDTLLLRNDENVPVWQPFDVIIDGTTSPFTRIPGEYDQKVGVTFNAHLDNMLADARMDDGGTTLVPMGTWLPPGLSQHNLWEMLSLYAVNGGWADFSHTARTVLPPTAGVTLVGSASGVFLRDAMPPVTTPEPATLGLVAIGIALVAAAHRARAGSRAGSRAG